MVIHDYLEDKVFDQMEQRSLPINTNMVINWLLATKRRIAQVQLDKKIEKRFIIRGLQPGNPH